MPEVLRGLVAPGIKSGFSHAKHVLPPFDLSPLPQDVLRAGDVTHWWSSYLAWVRYWVLFLPLPRKKAIGARDVAQW